MLKYIAIDEISYICIKFRQLLYKNLTYLRKKNTLSQQEIANLFEVQRSTWSGYENGKSDLPTTLLKKVSIHFSISTDILIFEDIEKEVAEGKRLNNSSNQSRILAITLNDKQEENIELVPIKAIAGYAHNFADINFIGDLPRFSIPKLKQGTYRAFEIKGTSMLPINEGCIVIGKYIENFNQSHSNKRYVLVLREEGVTFKRVVKDVNMSNRVILVSDNPEFLPFTVYLSDVLELWEMVAFVGYGDNVQDNTDLLMQKMSSIEQSINQIINNKK